MSEALVRNTDASGRRRVLVNVGAYSIGLALTLLYGLWSLYIIQLNGSSFVSPAYQLWLSGLYFPVGGFVIPITIRGLLWKSSIRGTFWASFVASLAIAGCLSLLMIIFVLIGAVLIG